MFKIGFIGLGNLGKAIVKRLISVGEDVIIWNRTIEKAYDLRVKIAQNPKSLISEVDIVILNLADSNAVSEVLTGKDGLIYGECNNKIIIDTTTNHPKKVLEFHKILEEKGAFYLESPVLGSVIPASQGLLTILVSGDKKAFEKAKYLLEKIGSNIFYLETPSLATKIKLINNLVLGTFMATLSEAIALAEFSGIDKQKTIDILSAGAGNSMILNVKKHKIVEEDFSPHFSNAMIYKDLHYLQDFVKDLKRPLFTGSIVKELYSIAISKNLEKEDFSSIYKVFKEIL